MTTEVDTHDARHHSLSREGIIAKIAGILRWFKADEKPADLDLTKHSVMECIDAAAGDYKIIWDRTSTDQVDAARATFDRLMAKGYAAFNVKGDNGDKGEKITKFDPSAERIILVAPMQGG